MPARLVRGFDEIVSASKGGGTEPSGRLRPQVPRERKPAAKAAGFRLKGFRKPRRTKETSMDRDRVDPLAIRRIKLLRNNLIYRKKKLQALIRASHRGAERGQR